MPSAIAAPSPPNNAEPRLAGLPPEAIKLLQTAAHAIRAGNLDRAIQILHSALDTVPDHPEVLRLLGMCHLRSQHYDAAQTVLQRCLAQWPDYALARSDLASVQYAIGAADAAFASWRKACELAPGAPLPWFNLGRNLQLYGDTNEAIAALQQAHALAPDLLPALVLLGDALVHAGRFDEADQRYRAVLALHPACGDAWRGLANMKTRPLSSDDRDQLAATLQRSDLSPSDRLAMGFALGKLCEDQQVYSEAFKALATANAQLRQLAPWQAGAFRAHVDHMLAASAKLPAPLDPKLGHEVVFIVGLPRSGSTLFEQILATHSAVEGASELPDLEAVLDEESAQRNQPLLHWIVRANAEDWQRLGLRYLQRTKRWRANKPRHTDKMPANWLFSGLLGAMLPGAHIIDTRRDALETGWSCYKQQFYRLPHFACTLTDIAAYTRDHDRAMAHWQASAPQRIRTQSYEALLAEPAGEIRSLLAFCGLPFEAACCNHQHTARSVRTASAAQVRQPLQRDTARAIHYGALLDPLRFGLGLPTVKGNMHAEQSAGNQAA